MSQVTVTKEKTMSGPGQSVKTTTYQSRVSYESEPRHKSSVRNRSVFVNRSSGPVYGGGSSMVSKSYSSSVGAGMGAGGYQLVSQTGVTNVKDARVKEKKDMQDLNERFASYIEKVRFLEAQNRKLADELEKLKARWGKETQAIKEMYEQEMAELRKSLTDASTKAGQLEVQLDDEKEKVNDMEDKNAILRESIATLESNLESQCRELADKEAELCGLRNRCELMEVDKERSRKELKKLQDMLYKMKEDVDRETLAHVEAENRAITLQEELEFLINVHQEEMKELAALAYRDTTQENREFWKNEMGNALREIQMTYDEKLEAMRGELETFYNLKIQEFRTGSQRNDMETTHAREESKRLRAQLMDCKAKLDTARSRIAQLENELQTLRQESEDRCRDLEAENSELKNEVAKLKAEMEAILKELQDLMDTKLGLELEIAAYRKLLEGEENRFAYNVLSGLTQLTSPLDPPYKGSGNNDTKLSPSRESAIEHSSAVDSEISPSAPAEEEPLEEPQSLPEPTSPSGLQSQAEPNPESEAETEPDQEAFESDVDANKAIVMESAIEPLDHTQEKSVAENESSEADTTDIMYKKATGNETEATKDLGDAKTVRENVILLDTSEDHVTEPPVKRPVEHTPGNLEEVQNLVKSTENCNEEKDNDTLMRIEVPIQEQIPVVLSEEAGDKDAEQPHEDTDDTPGGTDEQEAAIETEGTDGEMDKTSMSELEVAPEGVLDDSQVHTEESVGETEEKYAPDEKEIAEDLTNQPDEEYSTVNVSSVENKEKHDSGQSDDVKEKKIDTTLERLGNGPGKIVDSKTINDTQNDDEKVDESKPSPTDSQNLTPEKSPTIEPIHKSTSPIHPEQSEIIESKVEKEDDQSVNQTGTRLHGYST